ncbi:MAG: virginiamycin lyase [Blastocatellia bacterium]|jgi:sugar lactone lactonase YvrE|nr:virginiamycin lyase [Blastocatellia bacterium]
MAQHVFLLQQMSFESSISITNRASIRLMTRTLVITITLVVALLAVPANSVWAHPAWGIVIDRNNQIYFSDIETVWKIDAQGKLTVFRAGVSGRHTHEINLDESGNLYGVDNGYEPATQRFSAALWKITPSGEFSYVLAPTFDPPKGMTNWKDRAGNSYYVGQRENTATDIFVLKRTPDGKVTTLAGNRKAGDEYRQVALYSVGGMAFGTDGTLYFIGNANLHKLTLDGNMAMVAPNLPAAHPAENPNGASRGAGLFGIAVDAQDNVFVADYGNRQVLKVTPDGRSTIAMRAEPPWAPTGVALKDGNLYTLEFGFTPPSTYAPRVRKLSTDGKVTTLAIFGEDGKPAALESSSLGLPAKTADPKPRGLYVLLGAGLTILALTLWVWIRRRRLARR